jgi:hypothetical protein
MKMQIVTHSLKLARREKEVRLDVVSWYKRFTHRRHRRAVKIWLKTDRPVRNMTRPLTGRYLE